MLCIIDNEIIRKKRMFRYMRGNVPQFTPRSKERNSNLQRNVLLYNINVKKKKKKIDSNRKKAFASFMLLCPFYDNLKRHLAIEHTFGSFWLVQPHKSSQASRRNSNLIKFPRNSGMVFLARSTKGPEQPSFIVEFSGQ